MTFSNSIREEKIENASAYKKQFADCVILTRDEKILLQERPTTWKRMPGAICLFGGGIKKDESAEDAVIRELYEELEIRLYKKDLTSISTITESLTSHTELIHIYFWHDKQGTVKHCHEGFPKYYQSVIDVENDKRIMNYVKYSLYKCKQMGLL